MTERPKNAYDDLVGCLDSDEQVEAIVFGDWGWGGTWEPQPPLVPADKRGIVLTLEEAKDYMDGWSFFGGYGSPECYAVCIWTNKRVVWVTQYDGSTELNGAPRNPCNYKPEMPGG